MSIRIEVTITTPGLDEYDESTLSDELWIIEDTIKDMVQEFTNDFKLEFNCMEVGDE